MECMFPYDALQTRSLNTVSATTDGCSSSFGLSASVDNVLIIFKKFYVYFKQKSKYDDMRKWYETIHKSIIQLNLNDRQTA